MQVKLMDGTIHLVSPALILRVSKMLPKHLKAEKLWQPLVMLVLLCFHNKSHDYMEKALHNIKRIALKHSLPTTEDDVKAAMACVLKHGCPDRIADVIYLAMLFLVSRFVKHLVAKYVE